MKPNTEISSPSNALNSIPGILLLRTYFRYVLSPNALNFIPGILLLRLVI